MLVTGTMTRSVSKGETVENASAEVHRLLLRALRCYQHDGANAVKLVMKASRILGRSYASQEDDLLSADPEARGLATWQVLKIKAYVSERLSTSIAVTELAQTVNLSKSYFCTLFKTTFGRPPHNYILAQRVERAKLLMATTNAPLSQIALSCGWADQAHLSRHFRRFTGSTASAWRRRQVRLDLQSSNAVPHDIGSTTSHNADAGLPLLS